MAQSVDTTTVPPSSGYGMMRDGSNGSGPAPRMQQQAPSPHWGYSSNRHYQQSESRRSTIHQGRGYHHESRSHRSSSRSWR